MGRYWIGDESFLAPDHTSALRVPIARSAPAGSELCDESGRAIAIRDRVAFLDGYISVWRMTDAWVWGDDPGDAGDVSDLRPRPAAGQITPCLAPRPPHEGAQNASAAPTCDINESATFATAASDDCGENDVAECTTATRRGA